MSCKATIRGVLVFFFLSLKRIRGMAGGPLSASERRVIKAQHDNPVCCLGFLSAVRVSQASPMDS